MTQQLWTRRALHTSLLRQSYISAPNPYLPEISPQVQKQVVVPLFFCPEFLPGPGRNYNRSGKARTCSRWMNEMKRKPQQEGENDEWENDKAGGKAGGLSVGGRFEA